MAEKQKQQKVNEQKRIRACRAVLFMLVFFLLPLFVFAAVDTGLAPLAATGLATTDIRVIIANIIRVFLGLLGVIALVLVLYGGYLWMTAAGNEEKIDKAKKLLTNAAMGLAIILSAYGITAFIFNRLLAGMSGGGSAVDDGGRNRGSPPGGLGGGIVDMHYPSRNASGIPRNLKKIIVTFKEPIGLATIIGDGGIAHSENIHLRKTIANPPTARDFVPMTATATDDGKTFVFELQNLLGSPSEPIAYTMRLEKGLKKANGQDAFGRFGNFYEWQFEVSTVIDTTPPTVVNVLPVADSTQARNVVVQVNMSEPIDPTVVAGDAQTSKVQIWKNGKERVSGKFTVSNQYQTIGFTTHDLCGKNSCGGDVFCLPESATIKIVLPSSALKDAAQVGGVDFSAALLPNGVVDLAGNAMDGNNRKDASGKPVADGPGAPPDKDNYEWQFETNDTIDLIPPKIESFEPVQNAGSVPLDKELRVKFSKPLWTDTFNSSTVTITPDINYSVGTDVKDARVGIIRHDSFVKDTVYTPTVSAGVKDGNQNCYFPCAGGACQGRSWTGFPSCTLP